MATDGGSEGCDGQVLNRLVKGIDRVVVGALLAKPQPHDVPARLIEVVLGRLARPRTRPGAVRVQVSDGQPKRRCKRASKRLCQSVQRSPGPTGRRRGALGTLALHGHHDQRSSVTVDCGSSVGPTAESGRRGRAGPRRRAGGRPRARRGPGPTPRRGPTCWTGCSPTPWPSGTLAVRRLRRQGTRAGLDRGGRGALLRGRDLRPHGASVPRLAARHRPRRQALLRRARSTRRPTVDCVSRSSRPRAFDRITFPETTAEV